MRTLTFRGNKVKKNYFEGWYFKFVDVINELIVILIPGLSNFQKKMAFLQYIIHHEGESISGFLEYSFSEFEIKDPFSLSTPHGSITSEKINLQFNDISLHLSLGSFSPLKTNFFMPSIMGIFEYLKMPCYHDIISLTHEVSGNVILKGNPISFHGKGYIEGDRGSNFPEYYLWAQCNHFKKKEDSLFLSVADISTPLFQFLGHIAIYYHEGKEYRFASYLGSKVNVSVSSDKSRAEITFKNKHHSLTVKIKLKKGNFLIAPMNRAMDFKIKEQVKSDIHLTFDGYQDESAFCAAELVNRHHPSMS